MGFLKKLASAATTAVIEGAKTGFITGLTKGLRGQNPLTGTPYNDQINVYEDEFNMHENKSSINTYTDLASKGEGKTLVDDTTENLINRNPGMKLDTVEMKGPNDFHTYNNQVVKTPFEESGFALKIPQWGYDTFIHERAIWQKGLQSPFGEPGYFYFKIFFDFDTQYGLFGGILNDNSVLEATNSAGKYLALLSLSQKYGADLINDRLIALRKFTNILSYINSSAPWFFKGIRGLDKALLPVQKDFSKERLLEIECSVESIDMRLSTLLDLYNFACYDNINDREIIPENLRKFNMMIMLFNTPIKHLHTPISGSGNDKNIGNLRTRNGSSFINIVSSYLGLGRTGASGFDYKMIGQDYKNYPSCKIFSFQNCEFVNETLGSVVPSSISNEEPFQMGKNTIGIRYGECLGYNMNEFNMFMFGSDGIYYDAYVLMDKSVIQSGNAQAPEPIADESGKKNKLETTGKNLLNRILNPNSSVNLYQRFERDFIHPGGTPDVDSYEQFAHNNLSTITSYGFGNLYGSYATKPNSKYYNAKVKWQANKISAIGEMGVNVISKLLGSHYRSSAKIGGGDGFLPGYGERAVGSAYWKAKLEKLKNGSMHGYNSRVYDMIGMKDRAQKFNLRDTLINMSR